MPNKSRLIITFESQGYDDDDSVPPMGLMNILSKTSAELVEIGREAMGHSSDRSPTSQPGGRVSELKKTDGGRDVAMNASEVDVNDVSSDPGEICLDRDDA